MSIFICRRCGLRTEDEVGFKSHKCKDSNGALLEDDNIMNSTHWVEDFSQDAQKPAILTEDN